MSGEPPMVKPPQIPEPTEHLIALAHQLGFDPPKSGDRMSVLSTRHLAARLVADRRDVSPNGAVYLDCREVEAVTPSFFDELCKFWPHVQPVGMNEDVESTWELVLEHRSKRQP